MNNVLLVFGSLVATVLGSLTWAQENDPQREAIALIEKMSGKVVVDLKKPGRPVISVDL